MSQAAAPQLYQIGPSPDAAINGFFEGHTEPRQTGLSCLFMGKSAVHAATSGLHINTDLASVVPLAKHLKWLLLVLDLDLCCFEKTHICVASVLCTMVLSMYQSPSLYSTLHCLYSLSVFSLCYSSD